MLRVSSNRVGFNLTPFVGNLVSILKSLEVADKVNFHKSMMRRAIDRSAKIMRLDLFKPEERSSEGRIQRREEV